MRDRLQQRPLDRCTVAVRDTDEAAQVTRLSLKGLDVRRSKGGTAFAAIPTCSILELSRLSGRPQRVTLQREIEFELLPGWQCILLFVFARSNLLLRKFRYKGLYIRRLAAFWRSAKVKVKDDFCLARVKWDRQSTGE
jgi:hypothetical protein